SETIDSYNDLPVANCDIIVSRTLQLQRNKYLAELSDQERVLADFLFYSEYNDVSMLSIDENNPATWLTGASIDACSYVFNRREEEKPGTPRRFWFNILPFCHVLQSFLQGNRIKRRGFDGLHHWNRRTIPFTWRSNQNDFDCGVYCIKAMEWYDGWNEKKHPITTLSTVCVYLYFYLL
ncbi:Type II iodothyronine deiodinase, partial [Bienertia sinuspersici]